MIRHGYSRKTVPWVAMSFEEQAKFDTMLRKKRKEALGLKEKHYVDHIGPYKVYYAKFVDSFNRIYHYEIIKHMYVGMK